MDGVHLLFRTELFAFPPRCNKEMAVKKQMVTQHWLSRGRQENCFHKHKTNRKSKPALLFQEAQKKILKEAGYSHSRCPDMRPSLSAHIHHPVVLQLGQEGLANTALSPSLKDTPGDNIQSSSETKQVLSGKQKGCYKPENLASSQFSFQCHQLCFLPPPS